MKYLYNMDLEIKERASNKAFSKILTLERDIRGLSNDIKKGGDGRLSLDLLQACLDSTKAELKTWKYITKLIETNE